MARVVLDPAKHPDAVLGDFSTPNPLVTFKKEDVAFIYGTKWKQRYFTKTRRRLLRVPRAMGHPGKDVAALLRRAGHGLVGGALPGRPDAETDGSAV